MSKCKYVDFATAEFKKVFSDSSWCHRKPTTLMSKGQTVVFIFSWRPTWGDSFESGLCRISILLPSVSAVYKTEEAKNNKHCDLIVFQYVATTGTKDTIYVICFSLDYATLGVSPREYYPRTGSSLTTEKHGDTDTCTKLPKSLL